MSIITLQVGQCGNQIGEKLFETIVSDCFDIKQSSKPINLKRAYSLNSLNSAGNYKDVEPKNEFRKINEEYLLESKKRFFTEIDYQDEVEIKNSGNINEEKSMLYARSILIDMESKVVNKLIYPNEKKSLHINSKWKYRETNSYTQKKGSGNNWSYGYCINGPSSSKQVEEKIRKEVEKCDRLSSFLIIMSMAGGTGSGVGSYYTELLNDLYERITICNNCIWPFKSGEVTLQNYNFLLTLNKLYETSDAIILIENDILNQICKRIDTNQKKEITFDDLNCIAGHKLASLIQPCASSSYSSSQNYLNEIIGELCPNSDYKLLSLNNVPQMSKQSIEFSTHKWTGLYRNAKQLLFTGGYVDETFNEHQISESNNKSINLCFFARGGDLDLNFGNTINEHIDLINSYFDANYLNKNFSTNLYGNLVNEPVKLWLTKRNFNNYDKSLTFLSNSQSPAFKIENLISKAWNMFSQKAYLHHYVKYDNFDESLLLNSFIFAEQLIKNYKNI